MPNQRKSIHSPAHHYEVVAKALHYLQQQQHAQPSLKQLAQHCAMSETYLQKVFSHWAGVSPKRFLQFLTRDYCRKQLVAGASVLECSNAAGLSSSSRLHDLMVTLEAVTPGDIKLSGAGLSFHCGVHDSPFGAYFIACTARGIHRLEFLGERQPNDILQQLQAEWPLASISTDSSKTEPFARQLFPPSNDTLAAAGAPLNLWLRGTEFQLKVWEALLRIPEGNLCTYSDLAAAVGQASAARAVGSAVAKNPVAWLIPCHRVIRKMGIIGEYRWGAIRKQAMLGREASVLNDDSDCTAPMAD